MNVLSLYPLCPIRSGFFMPIHLDTSLQYLRCAALWLWYLELIGMSIEVFIPMRARRHVVVLGFYYSL